jgi:hypothetical protein
MTLKIRNPLSRKSSRRLSGIPACKRLADYQEAKAFARYRLKRNPRATK